MKKIIILLLLLPLLSVGQNPFDIRTQKSTNGVAPSVQAETIDGRKSNEPSLLIPQVWNATISGTNTTVRYKLKHDPSQGLPIWLDILKNQKKSGFGEAEIDETYSIKSVLADLPGLFQWNENNSLIQTSNSTDDLGIQHIRYNQFYKNVKVKGGEWMLHLKEDEVLFGNGAIYPSYECETNPTLNITSAIEIAENQGKKLHPESNHSHHYSFINTESIAELMIDFTLTPALSPKLVYVVELRPTDLHYYKVWIDAQSGEVLKTLDQLCSVDGPKTATATDLNNTSRTVNTYQLGSTYYMIDATKSMYNSGQSNLPDDPVGAIWTIDAGNTAAESFSHVSSNNNSWSDKSSVSAHYNAGLAFDYFKNTHNRNSINGSGGTIISVVNVADEGGGSLNNAYWNGQAMFYGNGGAAFKPLAGALDVAGHELTHGVVSNSANLEYEAQSGAINESMADVFGAMIDRDDWKMGEDITKTTYIASGALRDLQNPHNGGNSLNDNGYQPEKMSEYYQGSQDNYGVHINSGIVNRAYYLIATDITKNKAEKIYYRALTFYLTSQSKFLDLRYAVVKAAEDLYGTTEVAAVKSAFDVVQIYDPNAGSGGNGGSGGGSDLPTNPGSENIISVDNNTSDPNTFYKSTTTPDGWEALSQNTPKRRCSVTDDGDIMYYVSTSNILYSVTLGTTPNEQQVSNDEWDNVAVSKDGNLIALISTDVDSSIWVYNFTTTDWKVFKLYNPTYSEGVSGGNVLYADQIEFDNTGQYILYDARNIIEGASGNDIDYWDVGVIRVWNNSDNDWAGGKVAKIFTQLPDGVSIGNATYAKNSPYIIAFDYIDGNSGTYSVVATNTLTNTSGTIFSQSKLGFPNFSNKDDKILFDANSTGGDPVIAIRDLDASKIQPKTGSNASILISDAQWGVWYANGTRSLLSPDKELLSFAFPGLATSPEGIFNGTNVTVEVPTGTDLSNLTPTFTNSSEATVTVLNQVQTSGVNSRSFLNPVTYKVIAQDGTSKNYLVKVTVLAGINELERNIQVYPNPAHATLTIKSSVFINKITCYTADGRLINEFKNSNNMDISLLPEGIYFLEIATEKGTIIKRFSKL